MLRKNKVAPSTVPNAVLLHGDELPHVLNDEPPLLPIAVLLHGDELSHVLDDELPLLDDLLGHQPPATTLSLHNLGKETQDG